MTYDVIYGNELPSSKRVTQVYQATHVGEDYLPYMHRSFISFSFGGKNIEDFNLIAYTDGDRIQRQGSSNFNNLTTNSDVLNGQLYWGTFFEGNSLSLELATDGMTQRQLDDFLRWFRGGETRELILAEHPNRGILARVAEPPALSLLPFEETTSINLRSRDFTTSTTLYRGEISITFQMDDPFWYSINNVFGEYVERPDGSGEYRDTWIDANGKTINVFDPENNKDAIKIMLEDGIPLSSMIQSDMLMGNDLVAVISQEDGAVIADDSFKFVCTKLPLTDEEIEQGLEQSTKFQVEYYRATLDIKISEDPEVIETQFEENPSYTVIFDENLSSLDPYTNDFYKQFHNSDIETLRAYIYSLFQSDEDTYTTNMWIDENIKHRIQDEPPYTDVQGVMMTAQNGVPEMYNSDRNWNFYYSGTAPAYPILEFDLVPVIDGTSSYIIAPANRFTSNGAHYSTFTIESENKIDFKFTTPNIYTSYNTAIQIFKDNVTTSEDNRKLVSDLYPLIRENVKHYAIRAWAIRILDTLKGDDPNTVFTDANTACVNLGKIFMDVSISEENNELVTTLTIPPAHFKFDSKTGIATGTFKIRDLTDCFVSDTGVKMKTIVDNVGDMVKSDWIVIKDRNHPTEDNLIRGWTDAMEGGKLFSHRFYHDLPTVLYNVKFTYNNMYL